MNFGRIWLGMALVLSLGLAGGCRSNRPKPIEYYDSFKTTEGEVVEKGSPQDPTRFRREAPPVGTPDKPIPMEFLVVHDEQGRPVYVELRRSSGNPVLDREARLMIISTYKFPPGQANTVLLTVDPKEVRR